MEKQLQVIYEFQTILATALEDLDDDIYLQFENALDEAISFYEKEIAKQNIDHTNYERELYRFNYENFEKRCTNAG